MAYQMAAMVVTLNDLDRYLSAAGLFKSNSSNICAAFYTISTDSVLARFLCISRASCPFLGLLDVNKYSPLILKNPAKKPNKTQYPEKPTGLGFLKNGFLNPAQC